MKIRIYTIGTTKHSWTEDAIKMYQSRIKHEIEVQFIFEKKAQDLEKTVSKLDHYTLLDSEGESFTSPSFATWLFHKAHHNFVIGGDLGVSENIKKGAAFRLSFSKMTFTHQMIRIFFLEQIYRSLTLFQGSKYHK